MWKTCEVDAVNLGRPSFGINTGIGFFNHMLDQFYSHAQVGVAVTVVSEDDETKDDINRFGSLLGKEQMELSLQVGKAVGQVWKDKILSDVSTASSKSSVFSCPLDEALVTCTLSLMTEESGTADVQLKPYGSHPLTTGRTQIGQWKTCAVESFFQGLAETSGLSISLQKIRGDNAHHIVESAFKACARALRNLVDHTTCDDDATTNNLTFLQRVSNNRISQVQRNTKETIIDLTLDLDSSSSSSSTTDNSNNHATISSGLTTLDQFLQTLCHHAGFSLSLICKGDTYVDEHHSVEDVCIALGQCLHRSLGNKAGLVRMWSAQEQDILAVLDLSNRPCLIQNVSFGSDDTEYVGDVSIEMLYHALESFTMNSHITLHLVDKNTNKNKDGMTTLLEIAKALGKTLKFCTSQDIRRGGKTASSKGTLSA